MTEDGTEIIWRPSGEYLQCRLSHYMQSVGINNWRELIKRSTEDIDWFWQTALQYVGIRWFQPYEKLIDRSGGIAWTKWFLGGRINIVDNCLDYHVEAADGLEFVNRPRVGANHAAIIWESEDGSTRSLTYGQLHAMSSRVASALKKLQVEAGDAVGIYMPMIPEVVAILFGCLKIGAVAVPVFSGFGSSALRSRMQDADVKIIFTAYSGKRRGAIVETKPDVDEAARDLPALRHVVVLERLQPAGVWVEKRDLKWSEVVEGADASTSTVPLDAEAPAMYLYTSGTTGQPKGTVQTHAGALTSAARTTAFAFDVRRSDIFFWFTDIGWMVGPWEMIGVTFWGGTLVIYEGAPNHPSPDRLWQTVEKHKVTILGVSPTLVRLLKGAGDRWIDAYEMPSLRLLASTGEPWDNDSYMWFFEHAGKRRCPIINASGGTELFGGLVQCLPLMPLKPCTLGAPCLGMDVDVVDDAGNSIRHGVGHLVCRKPAPSMTKGFLKDPSRYLETYFSRFPGIWYHGDWAKVDADGFWFIYGRSDDTIKVSGQRIGPGEIESILIQHPRVVEAAAIGVPHPVKGQQLVCFVVLSAGTSATDELADRLAMLVAENMGASMKPHRIHFVCSLPKTRTGKIVRAAIRRKYLGQPVGDVFSIENRDALDNIPIGS